MLVMMIILRNVETTFVTCDLLCTCNLHLLLLGVVHFCVRFFSNEQCSFVGGWVCSNQVAVHLENQKKYVHPNIMVLMLQFVFWLL